MEKKLLRRSDFISEEGDRKKFELEYFLTKTEHSFKTGGIRFVCYGAEITMREENEREYCDSKIINEIFSSKDLAIEFINKLAEATVTPCTLENVVSDTLIEALSK